MRTTLDIDDDILDQARELAAQQKKSIGKVISEVFRSKFASIESDEIRNGIHLLPRRPNSIPVTNEMIDRLREELGV